MPNNVQIGAFLATKLSFKLATYLLFGLGVSNSSLAVAESLFQLTPFLHKLCPGSWSTVALGYVDLEDDKLDTLWLESATLAENQMGYFKKLRLNFTSDGGIGGGAGVRSFLIRTPDASKVCIWDMNNDGYPDLAAAGPSGVSVIFASGVGDFGVGKKGFRAPVDLPLPSVTDFAMKASKIAETNSPCTSLAVVAGIVAFIAVVGVAYYLYQKSQQYKLKDSHTSSIDVSGVFPTVTTASSPYYSSFFRQESVDQAYSEPVQSCSV